MKLTHRTFLASFACAALAPAQGLPDCLVGDEWTRTSLIRRLVDRNADGVYDTGAALGENEAFDYFRAGGNTAFREILRSPFATDPAGTLYALDGELGGSVASPAGRILRLYDADGNGTIGAGEWSVAFDPMAIWASADPEMEGMATDGVAIFFCANAGTYRGVWRCVDINGDGDFMDGPELTPACCTAAADPVNGSSTLFLFNTPNTSAFLGTFASPYFNPDAIERIDFDPTTTAGSLAPGRFLIEDERLDCNIALEDLDNNGDFYGLGEIYLWSGTNANTNADNPIFRDANPDVVPATALLADPGNVLVDTSNPAQTVYYILEKQSNTANRNSIWRAVDANADGDVNDAGEISMWFQALGTDPTWPLQSGLFYMTLWNGDVFLSADVAAPRIGPADDHDVLLRLRDANGDGVIDNADPLEVHAVWRSVTDSQTLRPNLFPVGFLAAAPSSVPCMYEITEERTCTTSAGTLHGLLVGHVDLGTNAAAFDELPILGQPLTLRTFDGPVSTPLAYHIGYPFGPGVTVPLDMGATCNLTVAPIVALGGLVTDAAGDADLTFTIPFTANALGASLYVQSLAIDLGINPYNVTTSNTVRLQLGVDDYTFTQAWRP